MSKYAGDTIVEIWKEVIPNQPTETNPVRIDIDDLTLTEIYYYEIDNLYSAIEKYITEIEAESPTLKMYIEKAFISYGNFYLDTGKTIKCAVAVFELADANGDETAGEFVQLSNSLNGQGWIFHSHINYWDEDGQIHDLSEWVRRG